jgi:PEP-CTERM motif
MKAFIELQLLRTRRLRARAFSCQSAALSAAVLAVLLSSVVARSAPINYGTFLGNTVDYIDVTEDANSAGDSPPLFGTPSISGDSLDFDPVGFSASTSGALGNDHTDGNIKFMVASHVGYAINNIQLAEAGDTTLLGFGTDATFTGVTGLGQIDISEVDGAGINTITMPFALNFTPSGGTYGLLTDGGGGPLFNTNWSGFLAIDVNQILIDEGVPFSLGATKISINLDNALSALSEQGTSALIAKKSFGGLSVTVNIPEPSSLMLGGLVLVFGLVRRRVV